MLAAAGELRLHEEVAVANTVLRQGGNWRSRYGRRRLGRDVVMEGT
jgi:hypothetical protein